MIVWIVFLGADIYTWYILNYFSEGWLLELSAMGFIILKVKMQQLTGLLRLKSAFSWGSNPARFNFAFHLSLGKLLKEKICSVRSKFFPLRVDPHF